MDTDDKDPLKKLTLDGVVEAGFVLPPDEDQYPERINETDTYGFTPDARSMAERMLVTVPLSELKEEYPCWNWDGLWEEIGKPSSKSAFEMSFGEFADTFCGGMLEGDGEKVDWAITNFNDMTVQQRIAFRQNARAWRTMGWSLHGMTMAILDPHGYHNHIKEEQERLERELKRPSDDNQRDAGPMFG